MREVERADLGDDERGHRVTVAMECLDVRECVGLGLRGEELGIRIARTDAREERRRFRLMGRVAVLGHVVRGF